MKDHKVSEHVLFEDISKIFPNPRRLNYATSGYSKENSKIQYLDP